MKNVTRDIGAVGTVVRTCLGAGLLVLGIVIGPTWWDLAAAAIGYPLLAVAATVALARMLRIGFAMHGGDGAEARVAASASLSGLVVLLVGTGLTFVSPIDGTAVYLFVGASMLLSAVMGYAGCEVLALPNLVLGRRDAAWCVLYTPLDRAENDVESDAVRPT